MLCPYFTFSIRSGLVPVVVSCLRLFWHGTARDGTKEYGDGEPIGDVEVETHLEEASAEIVVLSTHNQFVNRRRRTPKLSILSRTHIRLPQRK